MWRIGQYGKLFGIRAHDPLGHTYLVPEHIASGITVKLMNLIAIF